MNNFIKQEIPPKTLLFGIRSIGYSFATAVADVLDNSIAAFSTRIDVYFDSLCEEPFFCILDNGTGMSETELSNALLLGSDRSCKKNDKKDLGRFGLGLKSASLSQCRRFVVASKKENAINAMAFDLDVIEENNSMVVEKFDDNQIKNIPYIEELMGYETGTLVVWFKFDRIKNSAKKFNTTFTNLVMQSKRHAELVFHRFYNRIEIYFNKSRIEKRDPFLLSSEGRQQTLRESKINYDGSEITITPYVLPYANSLTKDEKDLLGNPKSIYDDQGFYIYRNNRLILWGSWMNMLPRNEVNRLARIKIDIPSSLDNVWELDVKKSAAKIPDKLKDQIRASVIDASSVSSSTTKFPGEKEKNYKVLTWQRTKKRDGTVVYNVNKSNPVYDALTSSLNSEQLKLFNIFLKNIENNLPKNQIFNDNSDSIKISNGEGVDESEKIKDIKDVLSNFKKEDRKKALEVLLQCDAYKDFKDKKEEIRKMVLDNEY